MLCRYSYETLVHRSTDNNLVRNVSTKVASNVVTTVFLLQMTDESHSQLCCRPVARIFEVRCCVIASEAILGQNHSHTIAT